MAVAGSAPTLPSRLVRGVATLRVGFRVSGAGGCSVDAGFPNAAVLIAATRS